MIRIAGGRTATAVVTVALLSAWIAVNAASSGASAAGPGDPPGTANWSAYLNGPAHRSYSPAQKSITPENADRLVRAWLFRGFRSRRPGQPRSGFLASPTVVGGTVYIGSDSGWFYKLNAVTGKIMAKRYIGFAPARTCAAHGFVDTATVELDPSDHQRTVYVAGANGYLYALSAAHLAVKWRAFIYHLSPEVSDYFQWSSPTLARGRIYIGVSSNCDHPLVRGALISVSQATGRRLATFRTLPRSITGASIWSSAAVGPDGDVYVSTGNPEKGQVEPAYSDALIKLDPVTLRPIASFAVPAGQIVADGDFGASPTVFGPDVGGCDKNGVFYALTRATMQLAWSRQIGAAAPRHGISNCSAAAAYDGRYLYVAGPTTIVGGKRYAGSIRRLDPSTGQVLWQTGLPNGVIGSPTMDGGGLIAVGTYDFTKRPNAIYLVDADDGVIVRRLTSGGPYFAQSVFADGMLFTASHTGLSAWRLS